VPTAAAVYYGDMYVDREHSMQTARAIRGLRPWVTSEYEHDGLRVSNGAVRGRLHAQAPGHPGPAATRDRRLRPPAPPRGGPVGSRQVRRPRMNAKRST
jgi:hypothetical protein